MPKLPLKGKIYSQADFDAAQGIVERIIIHLDQPRKFLLSESERRHFERLRIVFGIMMHASTQRERIKRISAVIPVSERTVCRYMAEAKELFVDMVHVDREFERHFIKEKLYALMAKAQAADDIENAMKCLGMIIKMQGYDREDSGIKPEEITLPTLIFTSNPAALTQNIEYEEAIVLEQEAD